MGNPNQHRLRALIKWMLMVTSASVVAVLATGCATESVQPQRSEFLEAESSASDYNQVKLKTSGCDPEEKPDKLGRCEAKSADDPEVQAAYTKASAAVDAAIESYLKDPHAPVVFTDDVRVSPRYDLRLIAGTLAAHGDPQGQKLAERIDKVVPSAPQEVCYSGDACPWLNAP